MNKNINVLLTFFLFIFVLYSFIPTFDLYLFDFFKGAETPYLEEIFMIGTIIISVLLVFRMVQRWMAIRLVGREDKFIWIAPISKNYLGRVKLYLFLENLHFPLFGLYFLAAHPATVTLGLTCFAGLLETIIFGIVNANQRKMKCGITTQAAVVCERDSKVFYFSGLRKISLIQQAVYFEYKGDLTLCFPFDAINKGDRQAFVKNLINQINTDKIFVSETIKSFG